MRAGEQRTILDVSTVLFGRSCALVYSSHIFDLFGRSNFWTNSLDDPESLNMIYFAVSGELAKAKTLPNVHFPISWSRGGWSREAGDDVKGQFICVRKYSSK